MARALPSIPLQPACAKVANSCTPTTPCCCCSVTAAADSAAALAARRREVAALEAELTGRLDPIDWATYEPYLYGNKDRAAVRCQVGKRRRDGCRYLRAAGSAS